ncbi:MAG: chorismate synthase, partial [bacterium]
GAFAKQFLAHFGIGIASHVVQMVDVRSRYTLIDIGKEKMDIALESLNEKADASPVRCLDPDAEVEMMARIDQAKTQRDTVGGIFEVAAYNVPVGLGSHVHWERKLDARIAAAMMSIQAIKAVEIGDGIGGACRFGSQVHDEIYYDANDQQYFRKQNNAGGLEAGISNGMPLIVRAAMKPISTLMRPLDSVNMQTKEATPAHRERSDVCAVPPASIIGEAMLALVLADAFLEKFGGDSFEEIETRFYDWREAIRNR